MEKDKRKLEFKINIVELSTTLAHKRLKEIPIDYLNWLKQNNDNKKLVNKINDYLETCIA